MWAQDPDCSSKQTSPIWKTWARFSCQRDEPVAVQERAQRLVPGIEGALIPAASHDLPTIRA